MYPTTFIIGGCRSGKSSHALHLADTLGLAHKLFIATCVPQDEEMNLRVKRHQIERGPGWQTIEEPIDIAAAIADRPQKTQLIVIDCLTLWASNMMLNYQNDDFVHQAIDSFCAMLAQAAIPIILVSNEVGAGIVPENALARRFRDLVGRVNQQVASACHQVIWMVAGIPVCIKPPTTFRTN